MESVLAQLLPLLNAWWWPFVRVLAMLSAAPVLGEAMVPVTVRILTALVLSVLMLPLTGNALAIDPISLQGAVATLEQAVIGGVLGLAFHFSVSVMMVLGYVVSALLSMLVILVFFAIDGHLVIAGVIGGSFQAWPLGGGYHPLLLQTVAWNVAWIFAAAMLLAIPIVFATMVVQIGFGFLNRVAPTLNLFALGFSVITIFGLLMLGQVVRFIPEHYIRMTGRVLEMIRQQMQVAHG